MSKTNFGCPVHPDAFSDARIIHGADRTGVRGKTVRRKPLRVDTAVLDIPRDFILANKFVTLTADVMFVNGWPFLTTFSRRIRMITAEYTPSRKAKQLASCLTKVINVYTRGGYTVNVVLMDQEFDKVEELIPQVECNTTAAREHVGDIERQHRTIKERARTVRSSLPFTYLPKDIVIHLVYFACFWLNAFPHPKGISANMSPREIVTRKPVSWKLHARACFGSYVEGHEDPDITNNVEDRAFAGIYLGATGNRQGTVKIWDVMTGVVKKVREL